MIWTKNRSHAADKRVHARSNAAQHLCFAVALKLNANVAATQLYAHPLLQRQVL